MNKLVSTSVAVVACVLMGAGASAQAPTPPDYGTYFTGEALRLDLVHLRSGDGETVGLQGMTVEPVWPGPRKHLIDPIGYGTYRVRLVHLATGAQIYSRGYSSLFGEWLSTGEAERGVHRAMSESRRVPMPREPAALLIERRSDDGRSFAQIGRFELDPVDYRLAPTTCQNSSVATLHESLRPVDRTVDVVIVPDGYGAFEQAKMRRDAQRFAGLLLSHAPFSDLADRFSVRLVETVSVDSGPSEPRKGIFHDTALGATFDTFGSPRYLTVENMPRLRRAAACAPYDTIVVMVNTSRYGGGGIYGTWSIFPSDSEYDAYVFIHEFGHGFAGLGDEYYSSSVGYDEDIFYKNGHEPWEPNITAASDREHTKWADLIDAATPVPTPDDPVYDGVVGLFEGAGYKARGLYRPMRTSKMRGKGHLPFGPVNDRAIRTMVDYLSGGEIDK